MTRLERAYPRRRTLGAVACLQCLPPREGPEQQPARPDMPGPPSASAGRKTQSVPGRSLQRTGTRAGRNPAEPELRPGPLDDALWPLAFSIPWRGFAGLAGLGLQVERTR